MSLENEIKALRESIDALNETLKASKPSEFIKIQDPTDELILEHAKADEIVIDLKAEEVSYEGNQFADNPAQTAMDFDIPEANHDDLKMACLEKVRKDAKNKATIKAILSEYGVAKSTEVPADKIREVLDRVEAL